jgi:hypothetical protein
MDDAHFPIRRNIRRYATDTASHMRRTKQESMAMWHRVVWWAGNLLPYDRGSNLSTILHGVTYQNTVIFKQELINHKLTRYLVNLTCSNSGKNITNFIHSVGANNLTCRPKLPRLRTRGNPPNDFIIELGEHQHHHQSTHDCRQLLLLL